MIKSESSKSIKNNSSSSSDKSQQQDKDNKKHSINLSHGAYKKAKELVEKKGGTLSDFVNGIILQFGKRDLFIKMYAPDIEEEHVSDNSIFLRDSKINKTAVVKLQQYEDKDLENTGFYAFCEACESDSCIHVRHSLASASILRLHISDKMA